MDVSALGNVHTLNLNCCGGIVDVSALGNVQTLNLSCFKQIVDVSALGNVHTLDLSYCKQIVGVSAIRRHVHALDLKGCSVALAFNVWFTCQYL